MPKPIGVIVFFDPDTQALRVSVPFEQGTERPVRDFTSGYNNRACLIPPSPPTDPLSHYVGQSLANYDETFRLFRDAANSRDDRIEKIRNVFVGAGGYPVKLSDANRELLIQVLDAQLATNRDSSGLDALGDGYSGSCSPTPKTASPRPVGRDPAVG